MLQGQKKYLSSLLIQKTRYSLENICYLWHVKGEDLFSLKSLDLELGDSHLLSLINEIH